MAYALADVTHLRTIYEVLSKRLEETGRGAWVEEELAVLTDPPTYRADPDEAWTRIKTRSTAPRFLAALRELARLRETLAQKQQRAAGADPEGRRAARARRQPARRATRTSASRGCCCARRGAARSPTASSRRSPPPRRCRPPRCRSRRAPQRKPGAEALADLLRVLLKARAETEGVAQRLIASSAPSSTPSPPATARTSPALHGWRHEVFGRDALRLKRGEIALSADGGAVKVVPLA